MADSTNIHKGRGAAIAQFGSAEPVGWKAVSARAKFTWAETERGHGGAGFIEKRGMAKENHQEDPNFRQGGFQPSARPSRPPLTERAIEIAPGPIQGFRGLRFLGGAGLEIGVGKERGGIAVAGGERACHRCNILPVSY